MPVGRLPSLSKKVPADLDRILLLDRILGDIQEDVGVQNMSHFFEKPGPGPGHWLKFPQEEIWKRYSEIID